MTDPGIRRVGLLGGAFDPPHLTHVAMAQAAIAQLQLDVLHVVPTGLAWHKQRTLTDASHRLAMCHLAFDDVRGAVVDERETRRVGPSYTIDTLDELQAENPAAQLYLVIGEDQAALLSTWHRAADIARAAIICVASRADSKPAPASPDAPEMQPVAAFQRLQLPPSPLSSTDIRDRMVRRKPVSPLVFDSVARYIDQHHLYQAA